MLLARLTTALLLAGCMASCSEEKKPAATVARDSDVDVAYAKMADAILHYACDQWAFNHDAGHDTVPSERIIDIANSDFRHHIDKTKYYDQVNNVVMRTRQIAAAGGFRSADQKEYSFVIGTGQSGLIVCIWRRGNWTDDAPPGRGIAGGIGIESEDIRKTFEIDVGRWLDKEKTHLRIPYKLQGKTGTIDVRRSDKEWVIVPDRGTLGLGGWWTIDGGLSATQPK